nr:acyltransferase family protein [Prevotella sp. 10(H)]
MELQTKFYPQRNITLDYFKLILTILVLTIHTPIFPNAFITDLFRNGIARIAVPCYFIINGFYFAFLKNDDKKVFRYLKKILIMYITWSLIYAGISVYYHYPVFTSVFFGFHHLWYIVALFGASLIIYLIHKIAKRVNRKIILVSAIIIYLSAWAILRIFTNDTYILQNGISLFRNFLFMGFPFVFVGYYISTLLTQKPIEIRKSLLLFFIISGFVLLFAEKTILNYFEIKFLGDFYFSLIFLCPVLFLFILKISRYKESDGYMSSFSSGIYLIHILVILLLKMLSNDTYPKDYLFVPILLLSAILSVGIIKLNSRIKIFL